MGIDSAVTAAERARQLANELSSEGNTRPRVAEALRQLANAVDSLADAIGELSRRNNEER